MASDVSLSDLDPVDDLAEEYMRRRRRGERPTAAEYAARYPEHAARILDLFPALELIEGLKPAFDEHADLSGGGAGDLGPAETSGPLGRLGEYTLLREIGRGGMGIVYEAEHESLKNRVALKVMHPRFRADRAYVRRFQTEARSAAKLHHTNIVPVFDYGEQEGVCYYAMQYIAGVGLELVLEDVRCLRAEVDQSGERGPGGPRTVFASEPVTGISRGLLTGRFLMGASALPAAELISMITAVDGSISESTSDTNAHVNGSGSHSAVGGVRSDTSSLAGHPDAVYFREIARLGAQIADALDYAHRQGVIHRDIKPPNLLLDTQGNVWVTDFGLAKLVEGDELSQSHDLVGTLRFMAPERFRGVTNPLGDVYSLGATLYELLTLKPAFDGRDQVRLVEQIVHRLPAPLRSHDPHIPRDLETLVLKALAKDAKDRFATAAQLGDELRRYLESRPILSRPVGPAERLWRWCRRSPAIAGLTALAAVLVVFVAGVSSVAAWSYKASLSRAENAERETRLALAKSLISEGAALERSGQIGHRFDSLDRLTRAAAELAADPLGRERLPEIRNHAITALGLTDMRVRLEREMGDMLDVTVDCNQERYARTERSGDVVVRRLDDNRELAHLQGPPADEFWHAYSCFSPDGKLLAVAHLLTKNRGARLRIWRMESAELLGEVESRTTCFTFDPSGRRAYFGAIEGGIGVWDRDLRRVVRRLPLDFRPGAIAVDPKGRRFAVCGSNGSSPRVVIFDLEKGSAYAEWPAPPGAAAIGISADARLLAIGSDKGDGRVFVWSIEQKALVSVLLGHTNRILEAKFANSGYLLATSSWDGTTRLWDGSSGEPLMTAPGTVRGHFAPDDRHLAFMLAGKVGVWEVAAPLECRTLNPGPLGNRSEPKDTTMTNAADVSPDGRFMATASGDGVRLWDVATGEELAFLPTGYANSALFQPDGTSLITASHLGLYRWPITTDPDRGETALSIGPPEFLRETSPSEWPIACWLPDRRTLALTDGANARVLLVDTGPNRPPWSRVPTLSTGENHRMTSVAASPDGQWLAVGGWKENGIRVWDLRELRLDRIVKPGDLTGVLSYSVGFSPDGRTLVSSTLSDTGRHHYSCWRVGTWELGRRIEPERGGHAFLSPVYTPDGGLMALGIAPDQVLLADVATGRELARLTTLRPVTPTPLVFSPDGGKLLARTNEKTLLLWNLERIREELATRHIDWEGPPYARGAISSGAISSGSPSKPIRVVGKLLEPSARRAAELAEMNRRLSTDRDDALALVRRGWLFTVEKKWPAAIADLEHALRSTPADSDSCWLLNEAYEQTGRPPADALAAFSRLLERSPDDYEARYQRGILAQTCAKPALALEDFSRILAAEPDRYRARYRRPQVLIRLGRLREALSDLELLIRKFPEEPLLYELRGGVLESLGDHSRAATDQEKANAIFPNDPLVLNEQAWSLLNGPIAARDPERAVAMARRATAVAPNQQFSLNTLGVALYRAGQDAESIEILERSLARGNSQTDAFDLFFLTLAHQRLAHRAQARDCFDRAVRSLAELSTASARFIRELNGIRLEAEAALASLDDAADPAGGH